MRPLNRPMFKYGGPIKEGIMNGMQDRPGYGFGSKVSKKVPFLGNLYNKGIANIGKIYQKIKPTSVPKFRQTGLDKPIGMRGPMSERATRIPFMERAGMFTKKNPFFVGATAPFVASGALTATPTVLGTAGNIIKSTALQAADLAVPDFIFDQDKYFENKKIAEINKNIEANKKNTINENNKGTTTTNKIDRDAEIEANRQRYYKILGIDKMKKDAAYDSLIDASKIVTEEGGDLKGAIKSELYKLYLKT